MSLLYAGREACCSPWRSHSERRCRLSVDQLVQTQNQAVKQSTSQRHQRNTCLLFGDTLAAADRLLEQARHGPAARLQHIDRLASNTCAALAQALQDWIADLRCVFPPFALG